MKEIEPKLKEIKEKYKDQQQEQARAMMAIYKEAGMNPFASLLLVFIQVPILIAIYFSVYSGGGVALPEINVELLYSFIPVPLDPDMQFLGLVNITEKSAILALLAGITQYVQFSLAMPKLPPKDQNAAPDFKDDFMRSLQLQMRYVLPVFIAIAAYVISAAIALYFVVSNVVGILQEFYIRRHR